VKKEEQEDVQQVPKDAERENGRRQNVACQARVAAKRPSEDLVVVFCGERFV
jgi:hypothetical protein